jgi:AAA family ATP:ADP antiporter
MAVRRWQLFGQAWRELAANPRRFLGLSLLAALVMFSYGLARPAIESLFLEEYTQTGLPWVWLAVAIGAAAVTLLYSQFARTVRITSLCAWVALVSGALLALQLGLLSLGVRSAVFTLYVWKDLYIVVLVEVFWSLANIVHPIRAARWTYGLFLVAGSLGSMAGELLIGILAPRLGTRAAVGLVVPVFVAVAYAARPFSVRDAELPSAVPRLGTELLRGIATVWRSRYLGLIVLLIGVVQVAITLIDFQFNGAIQAAYPDTDERTAVIGALYATINGTALVLQGLAGPVFAVAGVGGVLVAIPVLLGTSVAWFALSPRLLSMAVAKVASKALDYSLGRAAKEILYIPLSYAEKTQGKAFADIFSYRVAKGGASLLLVWMTERQVHADAVSWIGLACIGIWLALSFEVARRFTKTVRSGAEPPAPSSP